MSIANSSVKRNAGVVKRAFDIVVSFAALVILSPLLLFVAWQVKRKLGSPALFRQLRPGLNGRAFQVLKFRTMTEDRDAGGELLPDSQRLPRFGQFLRSTSLDELPELWNVLIGDMSLVGPRPLLMEYIDLYSEEQIRRHELRPGITGWAQVKGRNSLSWGDKFELDVWYVDHQSMVLDCKILLLTVMSVLKKEGISQEGQATMEKFTGDNL
jgi:lipopolysaccharide/colanic/teichoic acid biosynthesis glycosyltransferase